MSLIEKFRKRWATRRRRDNEQGAAQLAAEARGEAAAIHSRKDMVRDQRYSEDYPSRGGGVVGH
jgi:hypothetical protein